MSSISAKSRKILELVHQEWYVDRVQTQFPEAHVVDQGRLGMADGRADDTEHPGLGIDFLKAVQPVHELGSHIARRRVLAGWGTVAHA
jgi:hypothetical protein